MAEPSPRPMGWQVPERLPVLVALAVLAVVSVLLALAGWAYRRDIAPERRRPVHTFPAPGVETFEHDGVNDPERDLPAARPDPAVAAAKRAVVAQGWQR